MSSTASTLAATPRLKRSLTLWDLILYGIIVIQPVAPMSVFGVLSDRGRGHVVTTILIAMVAMLLPPSATAAWRERTPARVRRSPTSVRKSIPPSATWLPKRLLTRPWFRDLPKRLSRQSGVAKCAIISFKNGRNTIRPRTLRKLTRAIHDL